MALQCTTLKTVKAQKPRCIQFPPEYMRRGISSFSGETGDLKHHMPRLSVHLSPNGLEVQIRKQLTL